MNPAYMATFIVGDIHGYVEPLVDLLAQLRSKIGTDDTVVFLGDYIDRGPATKQCIDALLSFEQEVKGRVEFLCGNHEDWLLRTMSDYRRHSWLLGMEAWDTISSYAPQSTETLQAALNNAGPAVFERCRLPYECFFDQMPEAHLAFFNRLKLFSQTADCTCAHAGVPDKPESFDGHDRASFIWGTHRFPESYSGIRTVVYGHWNNAVIRSDDPPSPKIVGDTIGIDTIAHGVLTAVEMPSRVIFRSGHVVARF